MKNMTLFLLPETKVRETQEIKKGRMIKEISVTETAA